MSVHVREATRRDASEVARLLALLGHSQPAADAATRLDAFLGQGQRALVATRSSNDDGPLLGVATIHVTPVLHRKGPIGRITALIVDEPVRGTGIGRALMSAAEGLLAAEGCALIEVTSNKARPDAHAFYKRIGYTETSLRFAKSLD